MSAIPRWKTVFVSLDRSRPLAVTTADQAASALLHAKWPEISSPEYEAARVAVLDEIERRAPLGSARQPFIAAAKMADILMLVE